VLPVLFTLRIPAGWGLPVAALVAAALVLWRAVLGARAEGRGWGGVLPALRGDWGFALLLAAAVVFAARTGLLQGELALPLHSYGLLLALAFVLGVLLAQREARRRGQDAAALADLAFWLLVAGVLGSQVFYVLLNRGEFTGASFWGETPFGRWPRFLIVWQTGLVFYGGLIGAGLAAVLLMRRRGMAFLPYADTIVPSLALGHFLGRLGCFCAGCCWGSLAGDGVPWAVRFPAGSSAFEAFATQPSYGPRYLAADHLHTAALHPSQLYEAFGELGLFLLLVLVVRPRKGFHGQVLAAWLIAYAILRGVVEAFRGDLARTLTGPFNSGQWTSVAILAVGAAVWFLAPRPRAEPPDGAATPAPV
jgi:phosphatidylglycerol:prolipoprotein diacylglycerol transferase